MLHRRAVAMRRRIWAGLSDLMDGRVSADLRRRVAAAAAEDPDLRAVVATFAATLELLRECGLRSAERAVDEKGFWRCVERVRARRGG